MKLSHYEVLRRENGSLWMLGAGGMGRTYRARDTRLGHEVALKIIHEYLLDEPDIRERFLREARAMARINDLHVARILYLGDQEDVPFFAMEFCEGPTLLDYIRTKGPLPPKEALKLAIQLASALEAVGDAGLVHRDIKPSNIILTPGRRDQPVLRLLDFGVARTDEGWKTLTKAGAIGTPAFASPEQLREGAKVDARADLYAMGAVIWCMLTGKPPFSGTEFEIYYHVQQSAPPLEQLAGVPENITAFLASLLAKEPGDRPASATAAREALEELLAGVTATPWSAGPLTSASAVTPEPPRQIPPRDPATEAVTVVVPSSGLAAPSPPPPKVEPRPFITREPATVSPQPTPSPDRAPVPEPAKKRLAPRPKKRGRGLMAGGLLAASAAAAGAWLWWPSKPPSSPKEPVVVAPRFPPAPAHPSTEADAFAGDPPVSPHVPPVVVVSSQTGLPDVERARFPMGKKAGDEFKIYLISGTEVTFAWCPPGILTREAAVAELDGEPVNIAITKGFWLSKYEVTQSWYAAIMGALPSHFEGPAGLPVDSVNWHDAMEFCQKASENIKDKGMRVVLPDQHQWEYACRAGVADVPFAFGPDFGSEQGNIDGRYPAGKAPVTTTSFLEATTQVGSYPANAWGFYDMHGNVMEWCLNDSSKGGKRKVLRGGSWNNRAEECRSSSRLDSAPDARLNQFGFRISLVETAAGLGGASPAKE